MACVHYLLLNDEIFCHDATASGLNKWTQTDALTRRDSAQIRALKVKGLDNVGTGGE